MEETLASQKMAKIDLINSLEKISSEIPDRILKLEGSILKENQKEQLEIIIFRGYSSSTTHPIEIDSEKKVITLSYTITNFKLYKAPLTETEENFIMPTSITFLTLSLIYLNFTKCIVINNQRILLQIGYHLEV